MSKWLLLDGYNLVFRSYYAIPSLSRSDGLPTNAIHGWLRTIWRLEDMEKTENLAIFFDKGRSKHREEIYPEYKATRDETPEPLIAQVPWVKKICQLLGYPVFEKEGVEADDIIASAVKYLKDKEIEAMIVSADKDLGQLVQSGVTQILPPPTANPKLGWRYMDVDKVEEKFGIKPEQVVDYLALIGDTSDNIPGIKGVGPKTAVKWLTEFSSIDGILNNINSIKPVRFQSILGESVDLLKRNKELVALDESSFTIEDLERKAVDLDGFISILNELEMHNSLKDAQKRYSTFVQGELL